MSDLTIQLAVFLVLSALLLLFTLKRRHRHRFYRLGANIEETTSLVTRGAYRYIRHPLYGSLLLLGPGAWLKAPTIPGLLLLGLLGAFVFRTAQVEEKHNLERFGQAYRDYRLRTKMFIPFVI